VNFVVLRWLLGEQRVCIKFGFKLGKTAAETHQMLTQASDDKNLGQIQTHDWSKRSKNCQTTTNDDDRTAVWPSSDITPENVMKVGIRFC
jgi:hypothetical protein